MYGSTMQCNSKTYQMFQLSAKLCPHAKSSLNNQLINVCWTNHHSDVASLFINLTQNFNRPIPQITW